MNNEAVKICHALTAVTCLLGISIILLIGEHSKVVQLERNAVFSNHGGNRLILIGPSSANAEPIADVRAQELSQAYVENSSVADTMFEGKLLQVTGEVTATRGLVDGVSTLFMNNGINGCSIACTFGSSDEHLLDEVHPGAIVTVRGQFTRSPSGMLLTDCMLVTK